MSTTIKDRKAELEERYQKELDLIDEHGVQDFEVKKIYENDDVYILIEIHNDIPNGKRYTFLPSTHWSSDPVSVRKDSSGEYYIRNSSGGGVACTAREQAEAMKFIYGYIEDVILREPKKYDAILYPVDDDTEVDKIQDSVWNYE